MQYLKCRTIPQLSESEFWTRLVLQAAETDADIRHALVALAAIHEDFEQSGDDNKPQERFWMEQYDLAIGGHLGRLNGCGTQIHNIDAYLASCMVFICIEMLQCHYTSAVSLITRAVSLLYESHPIDGASSAWPLKTLEALLCRLQSQAIGLVGPVAFSKTVPPRYFAKTMPKMPEKFASVVEARRYFDFYTTYHDLTQSADTTSSSLHADVHTTLSNDITVRWSAAFAAMLRESKDKLSERDRRAVAVLKIRYLIVLQAVKKGSKYPTMTESQDKWDDCQDTFKEIVELAASTVSAADAAAAASSVPQLKQKRSFTLDYGLVSPLYDTARGCRDPIIRREAVRLLRTNPTREGLWDGLLAAQVAQRVVELEEGAVGNPVYSAGDVPLWARIYAVVPTFNPAERRGVVTFSRYGSPDDHDRPHHFQEVVEW